MTPYEIGIMLHYYCHVDDHPELSRDAPIWNETLERFLDDDLLLSTLSLVLSKPERRYELTARGKAYVEGLQLVPLPEQVWIVPQAPLSQYQRVEIGQQAPNHGFVRSR